MVLTDSIKFVVVKSRFLICGERHSREKKPDCSMSCICLVLWGCFNFYSGSFIIARQANYSEYRIPMDVWC